LKLHAKHTRSSQLKQRLAAEQSHQKSKDGLSSRPSQFLSKYEDAATVGNQASSKAAFTIYDQEALKKHKIKIKQKNGNALTAELKRQMR